MDKVRVSVVAYLNSKPFRHGLKQDFIKDKIVLSKDVPSLCAKKLLNKEVDLGLIPVAVIPQLAEYHIISDYCIGAIGKIASVCLYSQVPLAQIETVLLDYQSKTSVTLVKILAQKLWKISPVWENTTADFENNIANTTAAVIIGDRTFGIETNYAYVYDLGEEWEKLTGLPFVFACWVSNKKLTDAFITDFNAALKYGIDRRGELANALAATNEFNTDIVYYLTHSIQYDYDAKKKEGLTLFLKYMQELA
jgi:chorismate dehydratase